jgi:hypothetical protein
LKEKRSSFRDGKAQVKLFSRGRTLLLQSLEIKCQFATIKQLQPTFTTKIALVA